MPYTQPSAQAPVRPGPARRRSIVPVVRDLIADLSRNTGFCFAGDRTLARFASDRSGRSVTDRRIRQAITQLSEDGGIAIERGPRGRHLRPIEAQEKPDVSPQVARKFPHTGTQTRTRTDTHKPDQVCGRPLTRIMEILAMPEPPSPAPEPEPDTIWWPWCDPEPEVPLPALLVHADLDRPAQVAPEPRQEAPQVIQGAATVAKLGNFGIGAERARCLLLQHGPERLAVVASIMEYAIAKGMRLGKPIRIPARMMLSGLEEGWLPTDEQLATERRREQARVESVEADRRRFESARRRAHDVRQKSYWDRLPPEEQALLMAEAEARLLVQGMNPGQVTWRLGVDNEKWNIVDERLSLLVPASLESRR